MKKLMLVLAALACSGLCAFGQSYPDASPASGQSAGTPSARASSGSATTTVDGCLSSAGGSFTLRDKTSCTSYNLTGDTAKLGKHVGHEIQVTGSTSSAATASSDSGMNSSASQTASNNASGMDGQTLRVASVKMVAASCSAGQ
jgi:hypothetical protein